MAKLRSAVLIELHAELSMLNFTVADSVPAKDTGFGDQIIGSSNCGDQRSELRWGRSA